MKEAVEKLGSHIGTENVLEVKFPIARKGFVLIKTEKLLDAISYMINELNYRHLITITGIDLIKENYFEVIYHLNDGINTLSLRVRTPRDSPKVPTITNIIPGATLYEREIHELFGIVAEGHPKLEKLLLSEGWPEDVHPLRKDLSLEKINQRLEEEKKKGVKGI